jgi:hypothetical protein
LSVAVTISQLEKTMKIRRFVLSSLIVLCLALSTLTFAADNAYLYLVHGIPGRDVASSADPTLPVDVLLNDDVCVERGATFGSVFGPLILPPGQYRLKISPANSFVPCSNSPLIDSNVALKAGGNMSAIAALDEKGQSAVLIFPNDFASVAEGKARITLTNAGDAPVLQVTLQSVTTKQKFTYTVNPGGRLVAALPAGVYSIEVESNGTVLVPPQILNVPSLSATLIYAVGSAGNGSLGLVTKTVKHVF